MSTEFIIQSIFALIFMGQFSWILIRMGAAQSDMTHARKDIDRHRDRLHSHGNTLQQHEGRLTSLERTNLTP